MATTKDIQVCFNPHFDAVSLWIGSFGGADSPCDISRGVFAARQGVPRILEMFDRYGIKTTWDITGHSIESFPREAELVVKYGHEIGGRRVSERGAPRRAIGAPRRPPAVRARRESRRNA